MKTDEIIHEIKILETKFIDNTLNKNEYKKLIHENKHKIHVLKNRLKGMNENV